jgi:enoyl-CoA hydratase
MAVETTVRIETQDRLAVVTIDRPSALNALNMQVLGELLAVLDRIESDPRVGAVILTGGGNRSFVAGADIAEMRGMDPAAARDFSGRGQHVCGRLEALSKPVIAAVNGFCLGGGCELALACHLRVAARSARFGQPEVKLGLIPGFGGTVRLARLVGRGAALELLLTGEMISAEEAWRIGLVNRLVEDQELLPACRALAAEILERSPAAVRSALEAVRRGSDMPQPEALAFEAALFGLSFASADAREGLEAFLEKRPPRFWGREGGADERNHG